MWAKFFTTVKYTLVTVNVLCLVTGIIILSVGSSVQAAYNEFHPFLSERFFSLPAFCIATGVIIFLISFAGFYGAFMENYYMNMAFAGAMIIVFIFQLSACIAAYTLRGNTVAIVQKTLLDTMPLYKPPNNNFEITQLWDEIQRDFTCCGVRNASDWVTVLNTTDTLGVPVSCCKHIYGTINVFECTTTQAYSLGCSEAFGLWVKAHATSIGVAGIFVVLMQALAVAGALWIAKVSRDEHIIGS